MLVVAGLGISRDHVTLGLMELLEKADKVYLDTYTMPIDDDLNRFLGSRFKGKLVQSTRRLLEDEYIKILEEARERHVIILIPGDPLIATTHISLIVEAVRRGIRVKVIPGISGVVAAMTATGLSYYKFGRTATIPGPWRHTTPYSTLEVVYSNMCMEAHTLLLLDIDDYGRQLKPIDGLKELVRLEKRIGHSVLRDITVLIVWDAGTEMEKVVGYEPKRSFPIYEGRIASIVVPGRVNRIEAEHVDVLHGIRLDVKAYERASAIACKALATIKDFV
ncbi:MAG: diphthine synthase [Desulfurococcales archaeon]|nr:diphthine synthase [Desulfurococcales archaeon]